MRTRKKAAPRGVVLLVEDETSFARDVVAPRFTRHWDVRFADSVPSGIEAVHAAENLCLALVDLELPGSQPFEQLPGGSGFAVIVAVRKRFPDAAVYVLSGHLLPSYVNTAHRLGAGYLVKGECEANLDLLAKRMLARAVRSEPAADDPVRRYAAAYALTPRQAEVVALAVDDMKNKEIADALGISLNTLKRHIESILIKSGASTLADIGRSLRRLMRSPRGPES